MAKHMHQAAYHGIHHFLSSGTRLLQRG